MARRRTTTFSGPITIDGDGEYYYDGKIINNSDDYFSQQAEAYKEPLNSAKRVEDIAPSGV